VFGDIEQLAEKIMERIVAAQQALVDDPDWRITAMGPFVSTAVSVQTGEKSNRLLFFLSRLGSGGYLPITSLDGNERLLTELGFPRWMREMFGGVFNNNYQLDPEIYEKYKDR